MTLSKVRPKLNKEVERVFKEEPMLELPPLTIEDLREFPFTAKAIEQLEREAYLKGYQEGLEEARSIKTRREIIKSIILIRFGTLPKELEEKIENINDMEVLYEMLKRAVLAGKIEEIL